MTGTDCPLALAIADDTGESVKITESTLEDGCDHFLAYLTPEATRFVEQFDHGETDPPPGKVRVCERDREDLFRAVSA